MKTLTEKRDALLRRREELLAEWTQNKAAFQKRAEERTPSNREQAGDTADGSTPPRLRRVRITGILGELNAELDRLDRLIAEEAQKGLEEGSGEQTEGETRSAAGEPAEQPGVPPELPPALIAPHHC